MKTYEAPVVQSDTGANNTNIQTTFPPEVEVRPLTPEDAAQYIELLRQNEERMNKPSRKLFLLSKYKDERGLIDEISHEGERNGIWVDGQLAGGIDTVPTDRQETQEVSYWLDKASTRKGIGRRALNLVVQLKDKEGVNLEAVTETLNFSSMAVLEANGFQELPMTQEDQYRFGRRARK